MSASSALREAVRANLATALPATITVLPYLTQTDVPSKPTVMLHVEAVRQSTRASGFREYEVVLTLVAAKTTAGPANDELDDLLEDVLNALETGPMPAGIEFKEARAATYAETNPAYSVTLAVTANKE